MSAKEDTIALLRAAILNEQEQLLNQLLIELNINEISGETFQLLLLKIQASNLNIFNMKKALEAQEIIDHVLSNKIGE